MKKLLLFDIDGTLLHTHGAGVRGMQRVGVEMFGDRFDLASISIAGCLDQHIFRDTIQAAQLDFTNEQYERFKLGYGRELQVELETPTGPASELMPGIPELIDRLREDDRVGLGVLTGNYTHTGPIKMRHHGLDPDWFPVAAWGDMADSRPDLVPLAIDQHEALSGTRLEGKAVIVIGDTPKDIDCAHAHGCLVLAVATGDFDVETLQAAGADVAVKTLADPTPLLDMIAS
jgi:phosphoglycolate phosphatase